MFHFDWPWFVLLLPLPFLLRWLPFKATNENEHPATLFHFPSLQRLSKSFLVHHAVSGLHSNRLFFSLFSLIWIGLILALMQPERVDQYLKVTNKGYDLMLAVDTSGSMQALDFSTPTKKINRLDVVKEVVGNFVRARHGDRVGLVTFGERAYLHVPLTLDTLSVSKMLNDTVSGMAGNSTAIGDAIGMAVRTLRERPEGSRILILLTDGEDNASSIPPLEAAKLAKQYGIKIYAIGIGKSGPVPFPNQFGGHAMVEMPLDEELLKKIADITGGLFYRASDQRALESIYTNINALEKSESNQTNYLIRDPYYRYPLGLAMAAFLALSIQQLFSRRRSYGT